MTKDEQIESLKGQLDVAIREIGYMTEADRIKREGRRFAAAKDFMERLIGDLGACSDLTPDEIASDAVRFADALLSALEEG